MQLHDWAFDEATDDDREILANSVKTAGAFICGRRTYDDSMPWWGANGPTGSERLPVIVVSHSVPKEIPESSVYQFADGIENALRKARAAANGKDINVMGGADIGQQFLAAGLLDELLLHVAPVLLGAGTRLFENNGDGHRKLEMISTVATPGAVHLRYRVHR
jgi:dihydrofolate reductase